MLPTEAEAKACGFTPLIPWPGDRDDARQWMCRCARRGASVTCQPDVVRAGSAEGAPAAMSSGRVARVYW